uniref:Uncharacterized protein n=1 Tax=Plectus sambesii TaxID=2011161 RepID=A0A914W7N0_9BILA
MSALGPLFTSTPTTTDFRVVDVSFATPRCGAKNRPCPSAVCNQLKPAQCICDCSTNTNEEGREIAEAPLNSIDRPSLPLPLLLPLLLSRNGRSGSQQHRKQCRTAKGINQTNGRSEPADRN